MNESEFIQVITTTETRAAARRIARALVEARLAGCVQIIGPITSTYRWIDDVETEEEWLCQIKTTRALYDEVQATVRDIHPYDTPEIIALPVLEGDADYLDWLRHSLREPGIKR
ncbi:MAG: divalent-cation tolerance protein CutA [Anaerolineae bacterium]|nr:divalent-cation tolerance protein CutA [Anaerolineae bacterium]